MREIYNVEKFKKEEVKEISNVEEEFIKDGVRDIYNVEEFIKDGEGEISKTNSVLVSEISNGAVSMKTCANGHNNENFNVQMENIKTSYVLEAGTVWKAKNHAHNDCQPLIQKNECVFEPGKETQNLYMFCGDQSKHSPQGIEYVPTSLRMKNANNQSEVWAATQKYTKK